MKAEINKGLVTVYAENTQDSMGLIEFLTPKKAPVKRVTTGTGIKRKSTYNMRLSSTPKALVDDVVGRLIKGHSISKVSKAVGLTTYKVKLLKDKFLPPVVRANENDVRDFLR